MSRADGRQAFTRTCLVEMSLSILKRHPCRAQINLNLFSSNNHEQTYEPRVFHFNCFCGLVCPLSTSERGGKGDCVKEGREEEGVHWGATTSQPSMLRLTRNAAAFAAASPTLLFKLLFFIERLVFIGTTFP